MNNMALEGFGNCSPIEDVWVLCDVFHDDSNRSNSFECLVRHRTGPKLRRCERWDVEFFWEGRDNRQRLRELISESALPIRYRFPRHYVA